MATGRVILLTLFLLLTGCSLSHPRRITPPPNADSAWAAVIACVGPMGYPSQELKNVRWYVQRGLTEKTGPWAYWYPPNSIVLDADHQAGWVIVHELVHHRLYGPPHEDHPALPFTWPCQVQTFQHIPGGIMGSHRHP